MVDEMLQLDIIQPRTNVFSSLVILVKKKDDGWWFCVNYRALNKVTVPDRFSIPLIEEIIDEIRRAKNFSKLDLKSEYHQIRMKDEDIKKINFGMHEGQYKFLVMPFGLPMPLQLFKS